MSDPDELAPTLATARIERPLSGGGRLAVEVEHPAAEELAERAATAALADFDARRARLEEPALANYAGIVGQSPPMAALFRMLERIRNSDATVLVLGANGTGKELVARAIHAQSRRADKPFVATNCSAFNDNLLESELFGHRRGAFTGAVSEKPGLFSVADKGTFFMDEVGDMSPALQVKLLRVLQEGVFMPVGGTDYRKVDVRIIAATNRDLTGMVKEGSFREDLYYRLHVVTLKVPPLRERSDDIPLLVDHFLQRLADREGRRKSLTARAMERLLAHPWPGNVRELENEMERVWVLSGQETVLDEDLLSPSIRRAPTRPSNPPPPPSAESSTAATVPPPPTSTLPEAVEALERRMIEDELRRNKGNKTRTAEALGISRRNLIRKVQGYGLEEAGKRIP
jgi:two-component system response regulator HupR/HoxA